MATDEQLSRYLSTEWAVVEEQAAEVIDLCKHLVVGLTLGARAVKAAQEDGDVEKLSTTLTGIMLSLESVQPALTPILSRTYAHYVELLGSRDEAYRMADALMEFHSESPVTEGGSVEEFEDVSDLGDGFIMPEGHD